MCTPRAKLCNCNETNVAYETAVLYTVNGSLIH